MTIYDLAENELWSSGLVPGDYVNWDRTNKRGERLANGYYLYLAQGWDAGDRLILNKAGKVVLLPGDQVQLQSAPVAATVLEDDDGAVPSVGPLAYNATDFYVSNQLGVNTDNPADFAPGSRLTVKSGALEANASGGAWATFILRHTGGKDWRMQSRNTGEFVFRNVTDGANVMSLVGSNVGIGTITPDAKLKVISNDANNPAIWGKNDGGSNGVYGEANGATSAVGAYNSGGGPGMAAFSANGAGIVATSASAINIIAAWDGNGTPGTVGDDIQRFRVERDGTVWADGAFETEVGIRFHDGTLQTTAASGGGNAWLIGGNAGTTYGTNFLGTTDNQGLHIRVNNSPVCTFFPNGGDAPCIVGGHPDNAWKLGTYGVTISGGGGPSAAAERNVAWDSQCTIGGGWANVVGYDDGNLEDQGWATVGGGNANEARADHSTIGGGNQNEIYVSSPHGFIGGGWVNQIVSQEGLLDFDIGGEEVICGGRWNYIQESPIAFIGGGSENKVYADAGIVVGGGSNEVQSGWGGIILGGFEHTVNGDASTVLGGDHCDIVGEDSVAGGQDCDIDGNQCFVFGIGNDVEDDCDWSSILGGSSNIIRNTSRESGARAVIAGGTDNIIDGGWNSFAAGHSARVNNEGTFVWADPTGDAGGVFPFPENTRHYSFWARATGGFWLVTGDVDGTEANYSGVKLASGSGTWSSLSDRNMKCDFEPVDKQDVLDKIAEMPIEEWSYITQDESIRHIGPVAQDFYEAFGLGEGDHFIGSSDADGVALVAIQALCERLDQKEAEIEQLQDLAASNREEIGALRAQVDVLMAKLETVERAFDMTD